MKKRIANAKLIIEVESRKNADGTRGRLITQSVFDNRTQSYLTSEQIHERGIEWFLNLNDLKESANWNLNGDSSKYRFKWGQSCKTKAIGYAYICD